MSQITENTKPNRRNSIATAARHSRLAKKGFSNCFPLFGENVSIHLQIDVNFNSHYQLRFSLCLANLQLRGECQLLSVCVCQLMNHSLKSFAFQSSFMNLIERERVVPDVQNRPVLLTFFTIKIRDDDNDINFLDRREGKNDGLVVSTGTVGLRYLFLKYRDVCVYLYIHSLPPRKKDYRRVEVANGGKTPPKKKNLLRETIASCCCCCWIAIPK